MIVVFVDWPGRPHAAYAISLEAYTSFYEKTVVPFVDASYRTEARAGRRALVGMGVRGFPVLALAAVMLCFPSSIVSAFSRVLKGTV